MEPFQGSSRLIVHRTVLALPAANYHFQVTCLIGKLSLAAVERQVTISFRTGKRQQLTDETDRIEPNEAREALDSIQEMERTGLRRAIPPRWFGATIAPISGALVAVVTAKASVVSALLIAALALVFEYQRRNGGASPRAFPSNAAGIAAVICLIGLFFLLVVGGRAFRDMFGFAWAPLASGAALAIVVFILSVSDRREMLAKIGAERGE